MEPYIRESAGSEADVPKAKSGKKIAAGIAIGCGALVVLAIVAVAALIGFIALKKSKYDKVAIPFIESYLVELSSWQPERVQQYWAPEVAAEMKPEDVERLFLLYRKLGALQSHDPPEFRQVGAHTGLPYAALVTYQVSADFEGGEAMLTIQLVPTKSDGLKVWGVHIDSNAFLPQVEAEAGSSEVAPE